MDHQARLVHADINPKNILVAQGLDGWHVTAILDWEFSHSGCPYAYPANMSRFDPGHPRGFLHGFLEAYQQQQPQDLPLQQEWRYLGQVLDMFALSDLVTRPVGHPIADLAAERIEQLVTQGLPGGI